MMNINLNLLPNTKKARLETTIKVLFIKNILELFLLTAAVVGATLVWSWIFLENDFANLAENANLINREYYTYNQDAKNINGLIKNINLSSRKFSPLSPKLKDITSSLPADIKIGSLQINMAEQQIIISGTALSRSALLNYQAVLNETPWITAVETPVSQLFQKENINFEFKAKLKNSSIKN
ncbi:MAG: hypothetical protein HYT15_04410 [Candidatus Magasanikbacteria bacterium]|nr:hypothetical protein [Candidatus Magasanikbacteria bacterium]